MSNLNAAYLVIKTVTSVLLREDSRTLYYTYVHSIMTDAITYSVQVRERGVLGFAVCLCRIYYKIHI